MLTLVCACGCTSDQVLNDPKQDGRREAAKEALKARVEEAQHGEPPRARAAHLLGSAVYLHVPPLLRLKGGAGGRGAPENDSW